MDRSIFTTRLIDFIFPEGTFVECKSETKKDENIEFTPSTKIESDIGYNSNDSNPEKK